MNMKKTTLRFFGSALFLLIVSPSWSQTGIEEQIFEVEKQANSLRADLFNQTEAINSILDVLDQRINELSGLLPIIRGQIETLPATLQNRLTQFCNFILGASAGTNGQCLLQPPPAQAADRKLIVVNHGVNIFLDRLGESDVSLSNIPSQPSLNFTGYFVFNAGNYSVFNFERQRPTYSVPQNLNCRIIEIRARVGAYMGDGNNSNSFVKYQLRHNQGADSEPRFHLGIPDRYLAQVVWNPGENNANRIYPLISDFGQTSAGMDFYRRNQSDTGGMNLYSQNREYLLEPTPGVDQNGYYFDVKFQNATPTGGDRTDLCWQ